MSISRHVVSTRSVSVNALAYRDSCDRLVRNVILSLTERYQPYYGLVQRMGEGAESSETYLFSSREL